VSGVGPTIRAVREKRGWSQGRLAAALAQVSGHVTLTGHDVSRWERGKRTPRFWLPHIARALDLDLAVLERDAYGEPAPEQVEHANLAVDRDRLAYVAARPRVVDRETLDSLGVVLASTRRLEDVVGAAPVWQPVRGHLAYVEQLAAEARGRIRRDVVDQAGQWAQYIGWLNIAGERYDDASRWFSRSVEWAIEAEDDDLAATAWSFKGHLAWIMGEVGPTIGLTRVARRYRGIYAGQTAYDALQEARGHAVAGDAYRVERLVEESHELAERALVDLPGAPPWHYYRSPAFWELERGRALHLLPGRASRAVEHLEGGLDALPAEQAGADWVKAYRRDLEEARRRAE
jgi:transcriptional regulator with XRE-family HTH domain